MLRCSHSEAESYRKCERAHYYSYGMKLDGITISQPLFKGNVGHKGLEVYYQSIKDGVSQADAEAACFEAMVSESDLYDTFDKTAALAATMQLVVDYFDNYRVQDARMDILASEISLDVQLTDTLVVPMKVDFIVREPGYGVIAYDSKFTGNFFNEALVDINPQLPLYKAALQAAGWPITNIGYNELRTVKTKAAQVDPSEQFRRTIVPSSPARLTNTVREQLKTARRIERYRNLNDLKQWESLVIRTAYKDTCQSCSFKEICAADLNDADTSLIIHSNFKTKEKRPNVQPVSTNGADGW